ncbi:MAG: hypothetical protein R2735_13015 [Microthrixaceae bacterium]
MKVDSFINPSNFRLTGTKPEFFSDGEFHFAWTNDGASTGNTYEIRIEIVEGCLVFGTKTRTVPAGAPERTRPTSSSCRGQRPTSVCRIPMRVAGENSPPQRHRGNPLHAVDHLPALLDGLER